MQALSKATLESLDSPKAKALWFVGALRHLPDGFEWDYERVDSECRGCAVSLAKRIGLVETATTYALAEALGLNQKKVHGVCYHLHDKLNVHLRDITANQVADALEALI